MANPLRCQHGDTTEVYEYSSNPPCNLKHGSPCAPCSELTLIEAEIQELRLRLKDLYIHQRFIRRKRNDIHCFISNLPCEIASYIFALCLPPIHPSCSLDSGIMELRTPSLPLEIAAVCYRWRSLALSTPELWSRISIEVDKPDFTSINRRVQRSGSAPLILQLYTHHIHDDRDDTPHSTIVQDTMVFVKKHFHRVGYFCVDLPFCYFSVFKSEFELDRPDSAPLLQELHVHAIATWFSPYLDLSTQPPQPRRVSMRGPTARNCHLDWDHVSHLTLETASFNDVSLLLLRAKSLVNLDWGRQNMNIIKATESTPITHMSESTPITHSLIQNLTLDSPKYSGRHIFLHVHLPCLENLTIRKINSPDFPSFLTHFLIFLRQSACRLKFLDLTLFAPSTSIMEMLSSILQSIPTIQELRLCIKKPDDLDLEPFLKQLIPGLNNTSMDSFELGGGGQEAFLPFLRKFSYKGPSDDSLSLFLDIITNRTIASHGFQTIRPMEELIIHYNKKFEVNEDELRRILHLRAAGKTVSVNASWKDPGTRMICTCDSVKLAMETYLKNCN